MQALSGVAPTSPTGIQLFAVMAVDGGGYMAAIRARHWATAI